ncbi:MAG: LacI family transcriptional regulator [Ignavibacteria bacterium]|nr:LacI family transcriptional regulator [Ignavibacteria bacterium]
MKQITIKHIAAELNLSVSTVSRALTDYPNLSQATKDLVKSKAKELGYRPNIIARSLKCSTSDQIGIIVPEIRHIFFAGAIHGIEEVAYKKGFTTIIAQSNEEVEREEINLNSMYLHRVSGIIASISQTSTSSEHFKKLIDRGVNIVFFDRDFEDLNVPKVKIDDFAAAYKMTKFMLSRGFKKVIHFGGHLHLSICRLRRNGYEQAMTEAGLEKEILAYESGMLESDGYLLAERMIKDGIKEGAVLAVNDPVAVGALRRFKEFNIDIPGKVGVAGFSNNPITEMITPRLTTIEQPFLEMGRTAAELLIEIIKDPSKKENPKTVILDTKMIIRDTV